MNRPFGSLSSWQRPRSCGYRGAAVSVFDPITANLGAATLFHGGFPHRFEGRQFEDIDREDINGVRYLRELLAAGEAGGGYVEYMFDNPAVQGDEETGSPKVAYATGFRMRNRDPVFVVASGFYPDPGKANQ